MSAPVTRLGPAPGRLARYESMLPLYECNYRLLLRLIPDLVARRAGEPVLVEAIPEVRIELTGGGRYTSFLRLVHRLCGHGSERIPDLLLEIRAYHDARLAEVVSYQGHGRFLALYPQPNRFMYLAHEKQQVNRFLHEWLRHGVDRVLEENSGRA